MDPAIIVELLSRARAEADYLEEKRKRDEREAQRRGRPGGARGESVDIVKIA